MSASLGNSMWSAALSTSASTTARALREFGQAPRDGGQCGVVADLQVSVERRQHDEGVARACC
jgi:hypothetical protein